jgi:hypothetical protein
MFLGNVIHGQIRTDSARTLKLKLESALVQKWSFRFSGVIHRKSGGIRNADCVNSTNAIEFDLAPKWAEAIEQRVEKIISSVIIKW